MEPGTRCSAPTTAWQTEQQLSAVLLQQQHRIQREASERPWQHKQQQYQQHQQQEVVAGLAQRIARSVRSPGTLSAIQHRQCLAAVGPAAVEVCEQSEYDAAAAAPKGALGACSSFEGQLFSSRQRAAAAVATAAPNGTSL